MKVVKLPKCRFPIPVSLAAWPHKSLRVISEVGLTTAGPRAAIVEKENQENKNKDNVGRASLLALGVYDLCPHPRKGSRAQVIAAARWGKRGVEGQFGGICRVSHWKSSSFGDGAQPTTPELVVWPGRTNSVD